MGQSCIQRRYLSEVVEFLLDDGSVQVMKGMLHEVERFLQVWTAVMRHMTVLEVPFFDVWIPRYQSKFCHNSLYLTRIDTPRCRCPLNLYCQSRPYTETSFLITYSRKPTTLGWFTWRGDRPGFHPARLERVASSNAKVLTTSLVLVIL